MPKGATTTGTGPAQESVITGSSFNQTGLVQASVTTTVAGGARPAFMTASARTGNWFSPELSNIYNQFLAYGTTKYRI